MKKKKERRIAWFYEKRIGEMSSPSSPNKNSKMTGLRPMTNKRHGERANIQGEKAPNFGQ